MTWAAAPLPGLELKIFKFMGLLRTIVAQKCALMPADP